MKTKSIITLAAALVAATVLTAQNRVGPDYMIREETHRDRLTYDVSNAMKARSEPQGCVSLNSRDNYIQALGK